MKKCLIVVNTHKKESHSLGKKISEYLKKQEFNQIFIVLMGFQKKILLPGMILLLLLVATELFYLLPEDVLL